MRNELLAGAGFSFDEDCRVDLRKILNLPEQSLHRAAFADEVLKMMAFGEHVAQVEDGLFCLLARLTFVHSDRGDLQTHIEQCTNDRLDHVVIRSSIQGCSNVRRMITTRQHNDENTIATRHLAYSLT